MHLYSDSLAKRLSKKNLELDLQMTSITEKREKEENPCRSLLYIHIASLVSEKNDYMSSQYFLRYVLGISNKKHANFMDEEPVTLKH